MLVGHKPYLLISTTISGCWEFLMSKTVICFPQRKFEVYLQCLAVLTSSIHTLVIQVCTYMYVHTSISTSHTCKPFLVPKPSQVSSLEQYAMRSYSDALDSIPMALADNAGLSPIYYLSQVKSRQIAEKNPRLGVDCMQKGNSGKL